jgi:hypothetical protein
MTLKLWFMFYDLLFYVVILFSPFIIFLRFFWGSYKLNNIPHIWLGGFLLLFPSLLNWNINNNVDGLGIPFLDCFLVDFMFDVGHRFFLEKYLFFIWPLLDFSILFGQLFDIFRYIQSCWWGLQNLNRFVLVNSCKPDILV